MDSSGSFGSKAFSNCFPTSLAPIIACLTAPESPVKKKLTSLEKDVPPLPGVAIAIGSIDDTDTSRSAYGDTECFTNNSAKCFL